MQIFHSDSQKYLKSSFVCLTLYCSEVKFSRNDKLYVQVFSNLSQDERKFSGLFSQLCYLPCLNKQDVSWFWLWHGYVRIRDIKLVLTDSLQLPSFSNNCSAQTANRTSHARQIYIREGSACKTTQSSIFSKFLVQLIQSKATLLHHLVTMRTAL